jgi:hypothetical protein
MVKLKFIKLKTKRTFTLSLTSFGIEVRTPSIWLSPIVAVMSNESPSWLAVIRNGVWGVHSNLCGAESRLKCQQLHVAHCAHVFWLDRGDSVIFIFAAFLFTFLLFGSWISFLLRNHSFVQKSSAQKNHYLEKHVQIVPRQSTALSSKWYCKWITRESFASCIFRKSVISCMKMQRCW